ncbi:hypothetical protein [Mycolicibacterium llatzerense]|uniref:hypothetical protein n=1 Tax=Mycolicibacterium llatzerense TaxID=280871 RepID=UPI0013A6D9CB|nr:hypothetical protein [Mycolicibacterium llatzerense]
MAHAATAAVFSASPAATNDWIDFMNVTAVLKNALAPAASPDCAAAQPAASI